MNREIKFRAWDGKSMYGPAGVFSFGSNYSYIKNELTVMQYTGLKDKNGKEIYEGDIVRAVYRESEGGGWYSDHKVMGAVYFDKNWGVKFDCREGGQRTADTHWYSIIPHENASKELRDSHWSDSSMPRDYNSVEIIGNIYENPELLKT